MSIKLNNINTRDLYTKLILSLGLVLVMIPIAMFMDYSSTSAFLFDRETRLAQYLAINNVPVDKTIDENGYEQIYYTFENEEIVVSESRFAKSDPATDNEHIVWSEERNGSWQIFLYHIPTDYLMQLTRTGNNINPKISNGNIVWQGWVDTAQNPDGSYGNWQIFVFDGKVVRQISQGTLAESPDIEDDFVTFSQRYDEGSKVYGYSIEADALQEVTPEFINGTFTHLSDGDVYFGRDLNDSEKHEQKINELFLLDMPFEPEPGQPEEVNTENMRDYLEKLIQDAETLESSRQTEQEQPEELPQ